MNYKIWKDILFQLTFQFCGNFFLTYSFNLKIYEKILIIFLTFFIVSCGDNVKNDNIEKILENKENSKNISQESEW